MNAHWTTFWAFNIFFLAPPGCCVNLQWTMSSCYCCGSLTVAPARFQKSQQGGKANIQLLRMILFCNLSYHVLLNKIVLNPTVSQNDILLCKEMAVMPK